MKDWMITARQQKREIKIWLVSLLIAFLLNVYSIIWYKTAWSELWTQLVWVLVLSFAIYVLLWIPRLILLFLKLGKKQK